MAFINIYIYTTASIFHKSIAGRYRPVSYPDGPITGRYRFIKNAYWDRSKLKTNLIITFLRRLRNRKSIQRNMKGRNQWIDRKKKENFQDCTFSASTPDQSGYRRQRRTIPPEHFKISLEPTQNLEPNCLGSIYQIRSYGYIGWQWVPQLGKNL